MNTICDTTPNKRHQSGEIIPPEHGGQIYRRILVGTDFSSPSVHAFEQALKLAKQNGAELLIAHSSEVPYNFWFPNADSYDEWKKYCRTEGEKSIGSLKRTAHEEGVKAHTLILTGFADESIIDAAKRLNVDLIVIGTHGRRGLSKILLGSVAASVVALAPCPVLTIR